MRIETVPGRVARQAQQHEIRRLRSLLAEAAEAHHEFEENELAGRSDPDWPAWYARYLISHGLVDLIGRDFSETGLSQLLRKCDDVYRRDQPAEEWQDYYARGIATTDPGSSDTTTG
ncbi:MAG TPA: hypothetical protein VF960_03720 [Chloroflexota bacterium]